MIEIPLMSWEMFAIVFGMTGCFIVGLILGFGEGIRHQPNQT